MESDSFRNSVFSPVFCIILTKLFDDIPERVGYSFENDTVIEYKNKWGIL
jgi:hypothetical protein